MSTNPDELTKDQREEAKKWLSNKFSKCPSCSEDGHWWVADQRLAFVGPAAFGGKQKPFPFFPALLVVCGNCAHFQFHSTIIMGIDKPKSNE